MPHRKKIPGGTLAHLDAGISSTVSVMENVTRLEIPEPSPQ